MRVFFDHVIAFRSNIRVTLTSEIWNFITILHIYIIYSLACREENLFHNFLLLFYEYTLYDTVLISQAIYCINS